MIKFFRRIRQKLISENRFTKYLFYAIGEIILVIIGILIALQINNANENRKNEESVRIILRQIHSELAENIKQSNTINRIYQRKDSIIRLIMNEKIDIKKHKGKYDGVIDNNSILLVKDEGFKNLISNSSIIPRKYDSLVSKLKTLFISQKEGIEFDNKAIDNTTLEYQKWLKYNALWYKKRYYSFESKPTANEIEFYTSKNSLFKNFVYTYSLKIDNQQTTINRFRYQSYALYRELTKLLKLPKKEIASFSVSLTDKQKQEIIGTYQRDERLINIYLKEDKLYWKSKQGVETELIMLSENTFSFFAPIFYAYYSIIKEPNKVITGIKAHIMNTEVIFKKIK